MINENNHKQANRLMFFIVLLVLAVGVIYWYSDSLSGERKTDGFLSKTSDDSPMLENTIDFTDFKGDESNDFLEKDIVDKKTIPSASLVESTNEDNAKEGGFDNEISNNFRSISDGIEQLSASLDKEAENNISTTVDAIKQSLLDLAKHDTSALKNLIDFLEANLTNKLVKNELIDVLSTIKDPEVEQFGLKLARSKNHHQIIDGLDLLGKLAIPSEETLELTTQIIIQNQEEIDILLRAIQIMPVIPVPERKRSEILRKLSDLSEHKDEGIRSASIFSISKWAKNEQQLNPVIQALQSNTIDDRISAMMALEKSTITSQSLKKVFIDQMIDTNELWEIRSISADSLKRFNLTDFEYSEYESFREKQISNVK